MRKSILKGLLVFIIMNVTIFLLHNYNSKLMESNTQKLIASEVNTIATELQLALNERETLTESLGALVSHAPKLTQEEFKKYTDFYGTDKPDIRSMQLAPNGVVTFVTNIEENREAIGHDLLKGKNSRESALLAIKTKQKTAVGPVNLLQGGKGLIIRQPIFNLDKTFWGFATVVIDFDKFMQRALKEKELEYTIIHSINEDGSTGPVAYGEGDNFNNETPNATVAFGSRKFKVHLNDEFVNKMTKNHGTDLILWIFANMASAVVSFLVFRNAQINEGLNDKIEESTSDLNDAISKLNEQNVKRNQVYGIIAHELKTPVSVISMLSHEADQDTWVKKRDVIMDNCDVLVDVIDEMRMLIDPDKKRDVQSVPFTVADLAKSIEELTYITRMNHNMKMTNDFILDVSKKYFTDLYRLRICITNLIRNACFHSKGSNIDILWVIENNILEIVVADNGIGIPENDKERIFGYNERGSVVDHVGSGLGLAISKQFMNEIDGNLELLDSNIGSSFRITVPLIEYTDEDFEDKQEMIDTLKTFNILYVEDNLMLRELGRRILEDIFNTVDVAEDGTIGLEKQAIKDYDLIITDYFMPSLDGRDMIILLRKRGYDKCIIGLTAATIGDQTDELYDAGADLVLHKPLSKEEFYDRLYKLRLKNVNAITCLLQSIIDTV